MWNFRRKKLQKPRAPCEILSVSFTGRLAFYLSPTRFLSFFLFFFPSSYIFPQPGTFSLHESSPIIIAQQLPISCITRKTFVLPNLGPRLIALGASLYHGRGFFVLRGFEPHRYSSEDNVLIYVGLSSYVAEKRGRQDEHNNMLR